MTAPLSAFDEQRGSSPLAGVRWPGRSSTGSVLLRLANPDAGSASGVALQLAGLPFQAKEELHLTLLSTREADALPACVPEAAWAQAFEAEEWTLTTSGRLILLQEDKPSGTEYSLITPIDCPALNRFRAALSLKSGINLAQTLPHITLWIRPGGRGIGLASLAEYESCRVRELTPDEAAPFLHGTGLNLNGDALPETLSHTGEKKL